ncbi:ATP-binding cassette domain-containing protein [Amycolatopsis sp. NPDC059021]|uniref:ATP-binding cassette domain-containing protein n=1 Tax=Amycolatopsis sp. NPDC059021 TaxID=3346704 RepID=UPI00367207C0
MDRPLAVRARGITKCFGDVVALDDVELDVARGVIHGLAGPNGAGKTTLLGLVLGLAVADEGSLEILGTPVGQALSTPGGVAGFVDGPGLYPALTARQNLTALAALRGRKAPIPSLNDVSVHGFPKFDTDVPDIYRYEIWKRDFEKNGPANLNMFWLSSDHTGGPPNAAAQVADNDLAVGRIVDTISHSPYWKDSAIFVVEDDSQAGLDHVDGHRAPIQIISPWARHGVVDNHYYSQITMIRTIEQILGIHPMNQKDSAATPMRGAFTHAPDFTPFTALPNRTSLTAGLKTLPPCGADSPAPPDPAAAAVAPDTIPADKQQVAAQWAEWQAHQRLSGPDAKADYANPAQMNHFTWYRTHGWTQPYPGEDRIHAPEQVPGAAIPSPDSDG